MANLKPELCFNCGAVKEMCWTWFCVKCTNAKEEGYRVSRENGEDYIDVLIRREEMLRAARDGNT